MKCEIDADRIEVAYVANCVILYFREEELEVSIRLTREQAEEVIRLLERALKERWMVNYRPRPLYGRPVTTDGSIVG